MAAEHAMELAGKGLTDIVCFHAQQCAEKCLKALLVYRHVDFPKTHDLRLLLDLVPTDVALGLAREQVVPLNRYVIEGRYPGDWEPITVRRQSTLWKWRETYVRLCSSSFRRTRQECASQRRRTRTASF